MTPEEEEDIIRKFDSNFWNVVIIEFLSNNRRVAQMFSARYNHQKSIEICLN